MNVCRRERRFFVASEAFAWVPRQLKDLADGVARPARISRAAASESTATAALDAASASLNGRPLTTGIPSTSK